jgi:hypothetical protein
MSEDQTQASPAPGSYSEDARAMREHNAVLRAKIERNLEILRWIAEQQQRELERRRWRWRLF